MSTAAVTVIDSPVAVVDAAATVSVVDTAAAVAVLDADAAVLVEAPTTTVAVRAEVSQTSVQAGSTTVAVGAIDVSSAAAGNIDLAYPAASSLSGHRVVLYSPLAGGWIYADRTTPSHAGAQLAVLLGAASAGHTTTARASGVLDEPSWAWPAPCPLYLDTSGQLTASVPTVGFLREVARAVSATRIHIEPEPAIILG